MSLSRRAQLEDLAEEVEVHVLLFLLFLHLLLLLLGRSAAGVTARGSSAATAAATAAAAAAGREEVAATLRVEHARPEHRIVRRDARARSLNHLRDGSGRDVRTIVVQRESSVRRQLLVLCFSHQEGPSLERTARLE